MLVNHFTADDLMVVYLSFALVHIFDTNKGSGDRAEKMGTLIPQRI